MSDVAIIVPVLRRPHRVDPLLESIEATTPAPHRVVFVCTPDDVDEIAAVRAAGADRIEMDRSWEHRGDYARKINVGYLATDEPLIFTAADDLCFYPGWFERARARLGPGIGVVGTNDLGNPRVMAGYHSTHSLVSRAYADEGTIDERRKIYHEGYPHEFCDDEMVQTAMARGAWAFAADSFVEHLHPHWGKAPTDDIYDGSAVRLDAGRRLYRRRKVRWLKLLPSR
jgi:glycosyltransferase involved in cell wall biosynthesis